MTFVSLNGTNCRVDIYKRGYEGNEVEELVAAANPFEYEEDDSEDTLNSVIRYRTGYLRIIEDNYGDLDELYPLLNTDRYIEFYYGENLDFNGFIQAQEFENPWAPGPREVELPVISPLGLAASTIIDYTAYNPPRWMSVETFINQMLAALEGNYKGYYFPKILSSTDYPLPVYTYINSLTFCPYGNKYDKTTANLTGMYDPKNVEDALTGICTWMGLILHDVPGYVIFQRLDYNSRYLKRRDTDSPYFDPAVADLTLFAPIASSTNNESKVMPMSKIEVKFAGSVDIPNMDFSRCRGHERGCAVEDHEFCTNEPVIDDFTGTYTVAAGIGVDNPDNGGYIDKGNICLGAYGSGSLQEMIMFRPAANWETGHIIATYTFYEWNGMVIRFFFNFKYGVGFGKLNNPNPQPIGVIIKCGNYYWNRQGGGGTGAWQPVSGGLGWSGYWADGREYCEVGLTVNHNLTTEPLTVEFYGPNEDDFVYTISNVGLKLGSNAKQQYLNKNYYNIDYDIQGSPSIADGTVERGYSTRCYSLNRVRINKLYISTGSMETEIVDAEPSYPYLMDAQDRLQIDVKMPYLNFTELYLNRYTLWNANKKWRVIGCSFNPWNDTFKLTLHHSVTFDT